MESFSQNLSKDNIDSVFIKINKEGKSIDNNYLDKIENNDIKNLMEASKVSEYTYLRDSYLDKIKNKDFKHILEASKVSGVRIQIYQR